MRFSKMDSTHADQLDFVPRERLRERKRLLWSLALAVLLLAIIAISPAATYAPFFAVFLMVVWGAYALYQTQISADLVMAAEYQNMLFTQAVNVGSRFAMLVRRDGSIVYASEGLSSIFSRFDYAQSQALEGLFEHGTVRKVDRERIMTAIQNQSSERLIFSISNPYEEKKEYVLTVRPLPRPAGFCLVRGREYLSKRSGLAQLPDTLGSTSIDKLDALLSGTPAALYITDAYGKFEYANPAFETMLGYRTGEIVEAKLSLHHVFFSFGSTTTLTEEYSLSDYHGEAVFLHKTTGRHTTTLAQTALRDAHGKAIAATGTLHNAGAK